VVNLKNALMFIGCESKKFFAATPSLKCIKLNNFLLTSPSIPAVEDIEPKYSVFKRTTPTESIKYVKFLHKCFKK
jgi:hypothetical protein